MLLSPQEELWAVILGAAWIIKETSPSDDEIKMIRKAFLTAAVVIKVEDSAQARIWMAHNIRETIVQSGVTVERTAIQRAYDVMQIALSVKPMPPQAQQCDMHDIVRPMERRSHVACLYRVVWLFFYLVIWIRNN